MHCSFFIQVVSWKFDIPIRSCTLVFRSNMAEEYLFCNFKNCNIPITKLGWITRCSHVFCEEHGNFYFLNKTSKVKCPACNESNMKETDVIKNNLNPHDMLLCCVKPEKVLDYVINASKLWSYQMKQKRKLNMEMLSEKYEKVASEAMSKLRIENNGLKAFIKEVEEKLNLINEELQRTRKKLLKYKAAYSNLKSRNASSSFPGPPRESFFTEANPNDMTIEEVEDLIRFGRFPNVGM